MNDESSLQLRLDSIADEFLERRRDGEQPSVDEYVRQNPDIAEQLREALETILMVDGLKEESAFEAGASFKKSRETFPQIPDYRIVSRIGEGGMGVVYEAIQESLGRRVALKVLPSALAQDAKYVERFTREAQSAAKLHHTNIVPVFEVGGEDVNLFYAMQFIEGHSLEELRKEVARLRQAGESLAQSSISHLLGSSEHARSSASGGSGHAQFRAYTKSVARIGVEIADALAYAHARGIIHRDVKPSNLILDQRGTVWLTDFGLAKTVDSDLTATGDVLGTIRYLAPEGFKGRADQQSDIYALGVTLFEMLTLRSPFDASNRAQLMQQIVDREPKKPRDIDERIPVDLETILLKAIDKNPAKRYASAEQLCEDLRRFIADQPVLARRASLAEQSIRWMRRNVAITIAMASLFFAVAILVVASLGILGQKKESDQNFRRAEQQRQLAEENYVLAYEAVDEFFNQVSNETLLDEPGMESLRKDLLSSASDFYAKLASREATGASIQEEYVRAVYRQATITYKIESAEEAIQLLRTLIEETPANASSTNELIHALVSVHQALGTYLAETGNRDAGFAEQQKALEYSERLIADEPGNWEYRLAKCLSIGKQVRYYGNQGDFKKAFELAELTLDALSGLDLEQINTPDLWMNRGLAVRLKGAIQTASGDYLGAIDSFSLAIQDFQRAQQLKPESAILRKNIAAAWGSIGSMQSRTGRIAEALESNRLAIEAFSNLVEEYPRNSLYKYDLSNQLTNLAIALWNNEEYSDALENALAAMELREQLVSQFPKTVKYLVRLSRIYQNVSLYYRKLENEVESEAYARKAVATSEVVLSVEPDSVRYLSDLSRMRSNLSNVLADQHKYEESEALMIASWESALESYNRNSAVIETGIAVAEAAVSLGEFLVERQKHAEALQIFDKGLEISLLTLDRAEGNVSILRQLWPLHLGRGECLLFLGDLKAAFAAKNESAQYAQGEFRQTVSVLEAEQLKCLLGEESRPLNGIVDSIPGALRTENGRIQLEMAFLIAANIGREAQQPAASETHGGATGLTEECIACLNSAASLDSFSAERLPWLRSHPIFEHLAEQPAFVDWMERFEDAAQ